MHVMKFGGTSMGDADRIALVANLILTQAQHGRVGAVVSAVGGVTNKLLSILHGALRGDDYQADVRALIQQHDDIISRLGADIQHAALTLLRQQMATINEQLKRDLAGIQLLGECPDSAQARILSCGECWSSHILFARLRSVRADVHYLASRDVIKTSGSLIEGVADFDQIERAFAPYRNGEQPILLMAGFIGERDDGQLSLLGRNGSDLSGALMAMGLHASLCEIWTDVDGVYSADPRLVSDAKLVDEMSYEEAMELSYFGAKVLHPKTIAPIARYAIPTRIKNTFNPSAPGTLIHAEANHHEQPVRGITCLDHAALINLSGPGLKGVAGMAARVFGCLSKRAISVVLITQSSSEYSISLCVAEKDAPSALLAIDDEFHLERQAGWLHTPDVRYAQSVLCIVGDAMRDRRGVAGDFFSALSHADINIAAIAQGSSERSISVVIDGRDSHRALRATHQQFFNTAQTVELFLVGAGSVGRELLNQIQQQHDALLQQGVALRLHGIANSKKMLFSAKPLNVDNWSQQLAAGEAFNWSRLIEHVREQRYLNPVLIDCTANEEIAARYVEAFRAGMSVVTPNKRANTQAQSYYRELRHVANLQHRRFLYEANVGAGLPVIDTLQNLLKSGDQLVSFAGILSGSLSFIFGLLEDGVKFSDAVKLAREKGFTEPDPRDDLSGLDVARKLLILYRETGQQAELSDVTIAPLFPSDFDSSGDVDAFMQRLPAVDAYFAAKIAALKTEGKVLRFAGEIVAGKCRVGVMAVAAKHPLHAIRDGENALSFYTRRYHPVPLVIRGYGAGAEVTAGGVFADILRTVSFNPHHIL